MKWIDGNFFTMVVMVIVMFAITYLLAKAGAPQQVWLMRDVLGIL